MNWNIKKKLNKNNPKERLKEILSILLENRHINSQKEADSFLKSKDPFDLSLKQTGIDKNNINIAIKRIKIAIKNQETIVIFGDYDADGITATAVLWETLYHFKAKVFPFIPHREKHGYGLSIKAIDDLLLEKNPNLIITVDNGIVAHEAAEYVNKKGIDLIITDHHVASDSIPKSLTLIHTTNLAGAGVAWMLSREIAKNLDPKNWKDIARKTLDLTTIGTVADQVPLTDSNRIIVASGLKEIRNTQRVGLLELFSQSQFDPQELNTYHINFVIAPRINAMGRLAHGLDSLRLLCTSDSKKAKTLADTLRETNQERQDLTFDLLQKAKDKVGEILNQIIIVDDADFHEGVIGLVAGRLTETHHRPSIVIGRGEEVSKASARSVSGVNIIELIRQTEHLLINAGGHPMAAGFTIYTNKIEEFKTTMVEVSKELINPQDLIPSIDIDCQLSLEDINWPLLKLIHKLEPFGVGNRKPLFCIEGVKVLEKLAIGKEKKHLKLILPSNIKDQPSIEALWFSNGEKINSIKDEIDIVFTLDENTWRGKSKLQLFIKDIKTK